MSLHVYRAEHDPVVILADDHDGSDWPMSADDARDLARDLMQTADAIERDGADARYRSHLEDRNLT